MNDVWAGIEFGDEVMDGVTGYTGIVTGRVEYQTGCARLLVEARATDPEKEPIALYVDVPRLKVLRRAVALVEVGRTTGPSLTPPHRSGPSRGS